ncbi:hypothetical protein Arno162_47 [Pectobacterium phage Arno162]|uniref:Uncharacterized protein n=1 Tax=Pectobacterium phage Arno162 TaxID=2500577 RepID=A0A678ZZ41_9CAUD|nr:hypothetical protein Arno162_47 [Pectobacterium phage Arno162]
MSKMQICSNHPSLSKYLEYPVGTEITIEMIEQEVQTRMRTKLGNGKITCEAILEAPNKPRAYHLYSVNLKDASGEMVTSCWSRVFQDDWATA